MSLPGHHIILAIFLMALVTYLPRFLPLLLLSRRRLPPYLETWLSFVPVAVLAALLGPVLFTVEEKLVFHPLNNLYLLAGVPTFLVALFTRNLFYTVLAGMGSTALLRLLL